MVKQNSAQGIVKVPRKPKTANEEELVRVIQATTTSSGIGNFSQLVQDMSDAGIVIGKNSIAIKADKVSVINGNTTTAMFSNGKLNAALIDADTITVNHLWAKSSQGGTTVGHFGNYDIDAAKINGVGYPLWVGATTAANAPFRVSKDGDILANSGQIGPFWISPAAYRDSLVSGNFTDNPDTVKYTSCIRLSKTMIDVIGKDDETSGDIAVGTSMRRVRIATDAKIDDYINPLYIKVWIEGSSSMRCTETAGIIVDSQGVFDNSSRAFWARFGSYAGFRRSVYSIGQTTSFNAATVCVNGYGLVHCSNTSEITVTCPRVNSSLQSGDELLIIRAGIGNIKLIGYIAFMGSRSSSTTTTKTYTVANEWIHLIYIDKNHGWVAECSGD